MKKSIVWLSMLFKRQLKKISLYIVLVIMIAVCFFIKHVADNFEVTIEIGVVNEDEGNVSEMIEQGLYTHDGLIGFKKFSSSDELKEAVQSGKVLGGYILKKDFSKKLLEGKNDEIIQTFTTPNNMLGSIANEIFFSFVMKEISYEELVKDTEETGLFKKLDSDEIRKSLREYFDVNLSDGSTFSVDYDKNVKMPEGNAVTIDTYDYISPVIIGVIGLMIFIAGMCGTINYYADREKNSLTLLNTYQREIVALTEIAIPVIIMSIAGVVVLMVIGMEDSFVEAVTKYAIYDVIVVVYCYLQKTIIRRKDIYIGFVPVFILMSVIFCPVFVNLSAMSPVLAGIGKVLPLYWLYMI